MWKINKFQISPKLKSHVLAQDNVVECEEDIVVARCRYPRAIYSSCTLNS